jgi:diaminopimelate decarboxylase
MRMEGVELELLAARVGTPFYCYSAASLSRAYDSWRRAFVDIGFGDDRHRACFAVGQAGAYGYVMSSEYNARPRPAQVWVVDGRWAVISARRTPQQMLGDEENTPWKRDSED